MQESLEKEFTARAYLHKIAIVGGLLMRNYVEKERAKGGVQLAQPTLMEIADAYSNAEIQKAIQEGTFEDLYQECWAEVVKEMPEYLSVM